MLTNYAANIRIAGKSTVGLVGRKGSIGADPAV